MKRILYGWIIFTLLFLLAGVFVPAASLAAPTYKAVVSDTVHLRTGPGTGYDIITTLYADTSLTVYGQEDGWSHVSVDSSGTEGWCISDALETNSGSSQSSSASTAGGYTGLVTEDYATMRSIPSFDGRIMGYVYQNQKVRVVRSVVGDVANDESDLWYQLDNGYYVSSLFIDPYSVQGYVYIMVNVDARRLQYYRGGLLLKQYVVNVGKPGYPTPRGTFSVYEKLRTDTMVGGRGAEAYVQPDVPWVMYFSPWGDAIHGNYWSGWFGTNSSHGCVSMPTSGAYWMYENTPLYTTVYVR